MLFRSAFSWTIENLEAGATQEGAWTNATVATPLTVKNPDGSTTEVGGEVKLLYATAGLWNGLVVYLKTQDWNGNFDIKMTFSAREAGMPGEATISADDTATLTTITWTAGTVLTDARKRCNPFYAVVNNSFWHLTSKLSDFKNRPDPPPPEGEVQEMVRAVERLQRTVSKYAKAGHLTEAEVWKQLATPGVLRSEQQVPAEVDMTRLQPRAQTLSPQTKEGNGD